MDKIIDVTKKLSFRLENASRWGHEAKLARRTYTVPRNINKRYICNIPYTNLQNNI